MKICEHKNTKHITAEEIAEDYIICQDCKEEVVWNEKTNSYQLDAEIPDIVALGKGER